MEHLDINDIFQLQECPAFHFPLPDDYEDPTSGLELCDDLNINPSLYLNKILYGHETSEEFPKAVDGTSPNLEKIDDDVGSLKTIFVEDDENNNEKEFVVDTGCMYTGAPMPYFLKIVWLEGRYVQIVVDFNNKPLLFPAGAHFRKLPSVPIPACPYTTSTTQAVENGDTIYVNARQSQRILKRRKARAKLAARGIRPRDRVTSKSSQMHTKSGTLWHTNVEAESLSNEETKTGTQNSDIPFLFRDINTDNICFISGDVECEDNEELIVVD